VDKNELLRTITSAYDESANVVERINDDRLRDPAMDDWTGKDVLAHLAWWQYHSARLLEDFRAERQPEFDTHPGTTTDEINDHVFRAHLDDSPDATRLAFAQTFERLLAAIDPLTDDELFSTGRCPWLNGGALAAMILGDTAGHYPDHIEYLIPLSQSTPTEH
jgi:hypothetical protein